MGSRLHRPAKLSARRDRENFQERCEQLRLAGRALQRNDSGVRGGSDIRAYSPLMFFYVFQARVKSLSKMSCCALFHLA